jgi:hypothetical protein
MDTRTQADYKPNGATNTCVERPDGTRIADTTSDLLSNGPLVAPEVDRNGNTISVRGSSLC